MPLSEKKTKKEAFREAISEIPSLFAEFFFLSLEMQMEGYLLFFGLIIKLRSFRFAFRKNMIS